MYLNRELEIAKQAAFEIGKIQKKHFRKKLQVIRKSSKDFVCNVDMECQNLAFDILGKNFEYSILSEEKRKNKEIETDFFWVIDPVDGTHNYISGLVNFGTSIALLSKDEFLLGVIYLPYFNEMYFAQKDSGAFMNDTRISVSDNPDLEKSMVMYDNQFHLESKSWSLYEKLVRSTFTTRILGSAVYDFSLIASSVIDARICNHSKLFDFAAGAVIVKEAGGKVTDFDGKSITRDSKRVLATNGKIHDSLLRLIENDKL